MSSLWDQLDPTPENHFRLLFYRAVVWLCDRIPEDTAGRTFLSGYEQELRSAGVTTAADWGERLAVWEQTAPTPLPVVRLRTAAKLEFDDLLPLFLAGLVEEDSRFGAVFGAAHGSPEQERPTLGLINAWDTGSDARPAVRRLLASGLLEAPSATANGPSMGRPLVVPTSIWDALRGDPADDPEPWAHLRTGCALKPLDELVLDQAVADQVAAIADHRGHAGDAIVMRGPATTGRRTILGAIARAHDRALLLLDQEALADDVRWRRAACLSTLLEAMPAVVLSLDPGTTITLPEPRGADGPLAVVLGDEGGLQGPAVERALLIEFALPDEHERAAHWAAALPAISAEGATELARVHRMTAGNTRRTAKLARARAALRGDEEPTTTDVRLATRTLHAQLLDGLAERVEPADDWKALALDERTTDELALLEARCLHRETLRSTVSGGRRGAAGSAGVRALFTGPSGTGKTLAARALAGAVGLELYRVDLATVVDKYLGETEKNLSKIFDCAEQADVAILLDEGDAMLAQRTSVQSSNDRYANLETNYLLQRLEAFEGILVITTNAGERIDQAFKRRMDVVVDFHAPQPAERLRAWELHLPDGHNASDDVLSALALRCDLTGGEIRNAVLHACLLALQRDEPLSDDALCTAVMREYRKAGRALPLDLQAVARA